MKKKYVLTDETKKLENGIVLHRIKAVRDFGNVKKGDLGGWIEKEENLSHEGNCWVSGNACVYDDARVYINAHVSGNVNIYNNARVFDNVRIFNNVKIYDNARIYGNSGIYDNVCVYGNACIFGDAILFGNARVYEDAKVQNNAVVSNNAIVYGKAKVYNCAHIKQDGLVANTSNYIVMGPIGPKNECITFYKNKDNGISVNYDCFNGTLKEFKKLLKYDHDKGDKYFNTTDSIKMYYNQYKTAIKCAKLSLLNNIKGEI